MVKNELPPIAINRLTGYPYGVDPNEKRTDLNPKEQRRKEVAALGYPITTDEQERPIRWTGEISLDPKKQ